jgi:hypothetical protein
MQTHVLIKYLTHERSKKRHALCMHNINLKLFEYNFILWYYSIFFLWGKTNPGLGKNKKFNPSSFLSPQDLVGHGPGFSLKMFKFRPFSRSGCFSK